jgi:pteridine reductase
MAVNARAPYLLTVALLPMLRTARGLVANISDIAAHEHWPTFPIHSASKAALESLTLSGAAALAPDGVRMVALAPGTIMAPEHWSPERVQQEGAAGKLGTPDALIALIHELAADPTRTGEVIPL